ncbi:MAG TPA: hypothetical protein VFL98_03140 [Candidatus Paceibacterota bacterium]|nr:hypothetical protein [Candidatus Paceibacterota bacterium]
MIKFALGLALVVLVRLIPHVPNVEPITATLMPYARKWGMASGAVFGILAVVLYDLATGTFGPWTAFTAGAYAILGLAAGLYFKHVHGRAVFQYLGFAIGGTILYDALTGLTVGPLFYGQPLMDALIGQIPFTLMHLASNIVLAAIVSPLVEKFIVANPKIALPAVPAAS